MTKIFLSYRRADSQAITDRIYETLVENFGDGSVFQDTTGIPAGVNFKTHLEQAVSNCDVLLVVIGQQWLAIQDEEGKRRLDNPSDFVRIEVETGLKRDDVLVIPLLVDNARMPAENTLPESLRPLHFIQADKIRYNPDFKGDMQTLVQQIRAYTQDTTTHVPPRKWRAGLAIIGVAILAALIALAVINPFSDDDGRESNTPNATPSPSPSPTASPDPSTIPNQSAFAIPATNIVYASTSSQTGRLEIFQSGVLADVPASQLTTTGGNSPAISPNGQFVAYESDQDGDSDIYVLQVATGEIQQLTNEPADDFGPAWSSDGSYLAFHSNRDGDFDIYVLDMLNEAIQQITVNDDATDRSASWSPDGTQLVYFSDDSGGRELYRVELATGEMTQLTENDAYDGLPAWSPDGTQILFASNRDDEDNTDIYVLDVETGEVTRLTRRAGIDDDPAWSPDGQFIVFESNFENAPDNFDLWVMDSDGTNLRRVVENPGDDVSSDW